MKKVLIFIFGSLISTLALAQSAECTFVPVPIYGQIPEGFAGEYSGPVGMSEFPEGPCTALTNPEILGNGETVQTKFGPMCKFNDGKTLPCN